MLLLAHELLLVLVHLFLHQLELYLLVMLVLLHQVVLSRQALRLGPPTTQLHPLGRLTKLLSRFLLRLVHVASVFLPDVRHLTQRRIVKEGVLRTGLLRHTFTRMLQLLPLVAVSHNLFLLTIECIGNGSRLKATLHGDFL